jgi:serine/threonine protein kinase
VAIKVLPPGFSSDPQVIKRFQQEAKTAAKLDHANIIPIYRVESGEGLNYFVMKYISGTSLEDVLESKQSLSYDYVQRILWEAALALGHAHSRGVVHRDVKPANIMFDHDGKVMLTDFGISKALQSATGLTGTGMILGTPHYMAPEQAKGQPVDGRADQYALGVVGYRLLAGSLPFSGDSVHTILYKHIFEEAPPLTSRRDVPAYLSEPIHRALSKDPDQRYPNMEEFAAAIWPEQAAAVTGKSTPKPLPQRAVTRGPSTADAPTEHVAAHAAPTTPMPAARRGTATRTAPQKKPSRMGLIALLVVAAAGAGGYALWRGGSAGDTGGHVSESDAPSLVIPPESLRATPQSTAVTPTPPPVSTAPASGEAASSHAATPAPPRRPPARERAQTPRTEPSAQPQVTPPPVQPPIEAEPQGFLTVDADPFGTVFIDGVNVGATPLAQFGVKPGTHTIRIESPGYKTQTIQVQVDAGNTVRKRITLTPEG